MDATSLSELREAKWVPQLLDLRIHQLSNSENSDEKVCDARIRCLGLRQHT